MPTRTLSRLVTTIAGIDHEVVLDAPHDLSIWMDLQGPQPNAFGLPRASSAPYEIDQWRASVESGAGFNCDLLTLAPHGNGTHTECVGHISVGHVSVYEQLHHLLMPTTLLSVPLHRLSETQEHYGDACEPSDLVITAGALHDAFERIDADATWMQALIVRTLPNDQGKCRAQYSGHNPAYLTTEAMEWVLKRGVEHLLVDVPSVDREEDSGHMLNHHSFWYMAQGTHEHSEKSLGRTITEMVWAPSSLSDGAYVLNLQVPSIMTDAVPSRPLLFDVKPL